MTARSTESDPDTGHARRAAQQGDVQRAGRIGRSDVVGETSPPPEMVVVFAPCWRLAEDSRGSRGSRFGHTTRDSRLARSADCVNDVLIPGAPAEVSLEPGADAFFARLRSEVEQLQ